MTDNDKAIIHHYGPMWFPMYNYARINYLSLLLLTCFKYSIEYQFWNDIKDIDNYSKRSGYTSLKIYAVGAAKVNTKQDLPKDIFENGIFFASLKNKRAYYTADFPYAFSNPYYSSRYSGLKHWQLRSERGYKSRRTLATGSVRHNSAYDGAAMHRSDLFPELHCSADTWILDSVSKTFPKEDLLATTFTARNCCE